MEATLFRAATERRRSSSQATIGQRIDAWLAASQAMPAVIFAHKKLSASSLKRLTQKATPAPVITMNLPRNLKPRARHHMTPRANRRRRIPFRWPRQWITFGAPGPNRLLIALPANWPLSLAVYGLISIVRITIRMVSQQDAAKVQFVLASSCLTGGLIAVFPLHTGDAPINLSYIGTRNITSTARRLQQSGIIRSCNVVILSLTSPGLLLRGPSENRNIAVFIQIFAVG